MYIVQSIEKWQDCQSFNSISEMLKHYPDFAPDTLYDYFSRQKLSEIENYKGYRILKRELIKSKRSKL